MMSALSELAKMALQFGGALLVARLTVTWALDRYKAEKRWERETAALTDLLAAIGDMIDVANEWISDLATHTDNETEDARRRKTYSEARRKLDVTLATAAIVLPASVQSVVAKLTAALDEQYSSWSEDLFETDKALGVARRDLVAFGRARMGLVD